MKNHKLLTAILTLILLISTFTGCENGTAEQTQPETQSETTEAAAVTEPETEAIPQTLKLNGVDISGYIVNYNKKESTGAPKAFAYLNERLSELYGVTLNNSTAYKDRPEILISLDADDSAIAEAYKNSPDGMIGVSGKRIFLMATNYSTLCRVIDELLSKAEGAGADKTISLTANESVYVKKDTLTVLTYNVQADLTKAGRANTCLDDMAASIRAEDPDVFGTQENTAEINTGLMSRLKGYNYFAGTVYNETTKKGNYVYWKTDKFKLIDHGHRYMSDTPTVKSKYEGSNEYRGFTFLYLESKETGNRFLFINLHADYKSNDSVRLLQLKAVTAFIKQKYDENTAVIVLGDFNATPTSDSITSFETDNPRMGSTLKVAKAVGDSGSTLAVTEFTTRSTYIFDHIFVTTDRFVTEYYSAIDNIVNGRYPSDHLPVVARLTLY